jgi:cobalt-zinc-cadmium efflux system outer membrane protein
VQAALVPYAAALARAAIAGHLSSASQLLAKPTGWAVVARAERRLQGARGVLYPPLDARAELVAGQTRSCALKSPKIVAPVALTIALTISSWAIAQEQNACSVGVTRINVVACALAASLSVQSASQELDAAEARQVAVSPLLPSNPLLDVSGARRTSGPAVVANWSVTLSQELEVGGQRSARRDAAAAAVNAQSARVRLSRRETALEAWRRFFDVAASEEALRMAERLTSITDAMASVARARADQGLGAPVDADLARAAALGVLRAKLAAERRASESKAALTSLLGFDPLSTTLAVAGDLNPVPGVAQARHAVLQGVITQRLELRALEFESRAQALRAAALRRSRIPNPTLSVFAQNDGIHERVLGAGVSFPVPLPGIGRTYAGEIAEADALEQRARTQREVLERDVRLEIATALNDFDSRALEVQALEGEPLAHAEETLNALAQEIEAGQLPVRDAVVTQQALIELLRAGIDARLAWCLASVDLAAALGMSVEGSTP